MHYSLYTCCCNYSPFESDITVPYKPAQARVICDGNHHITYSEQQDLFFFYSQLPTSHAVKPDETIQIMRQPTRATNTVFTQHVLFAWHAIRELRGLFLLTWPARLLLSCLDPHQTQCTGSWGWDCGLNRAQNVRTHYIQLQNISSN